MRPVLLALLLCGCGGFSVVRPFQLNQGQTDVLWIRDGGTLKRCWQHERLGPVCVAVISAVDPSIGKPPAPPKPAPKFDPPDEPQ